MKNCIDYVIKIQYIIYIINKKYSMRKMKNVNKSNIELIFVLNWTLCWNFRLVKFKTFLEWRRLIFFLQKCARISFLIFSAGIDV